MLAAISSCWALLLGLALLMLGNGLQGTLLGLRASLEGFPTAVTGVVMTGYFAGFALGSLLVPRMVKHVGHVRVFAALASLASVSALSHAVFVAPLPWIAMRLLTGFCFAGLYVVAESWFNDLATNRTRGQLLSVYMVVVMGGMGAGQLLLNLADPTSFELFVLISVLVSVALVPMLLSAGQAPAFSTPEPIGVKRLYQASPLGVVGSFATGLAQGSVYGMGAVFANQIGLGVADIAWLMAGVSLGAVLLQWPVGRLSDRFDRRLVIIAAAALSAGLALAALAAARAQTVWLLLAMFLYGGVSMPLYSLFIAQTNDHLQPRQMVSASAALVLVGGIGAALGPVSCALVMGAVGPEGFLLFLAGNHLGVTLFGIYRSMRRESVPLEEQRHYGTMAPRTSPIIAAIASRIRQRHGRRGGAARSAS